MPRTPSATASRSAGWTRARSSLALLGSAEPRLAPRGLPPVRLDGRGGHGRRARSRRGGPAGQGHDQGARGHDRRQPGGRGARPVARRRPGGRRGDAQRVDHRRPAARRDELPQLRRPDPARGVLAAVRGRPRAGRRVPARSGCRSPAGTSRSTTNRRPGRSRPTAGDRGRRAARRRRDARRSGLRPDPRRDPRSSARRCPGLAGSAYAGLAGDAAEDDPPALDLAREAALQAFIREAIARGPRGLRPGRLGRRARRRPRRRRHVGRAWAPRVRLPVAPFAGGRPVRREPVAPGRDLPAALRRRRSRCSPASTACRSRRSGRSVATGWSSSWPWPARPAPPRTAAGRVADALEVPSRDLRHAWDHGLARALGWEG